MPLIDFSAAGFTVALDGSASSDADGEIVDYEWSVGPDGPTSQFTAPREGIVPVTLTVTDDDGATGALTVNVPVVALIDDNIFPTAAFTTESHGLDIEFDGRSTTDPDGAVVAWQWNFGDGTTGQGPTPRTATRSLVCTQSSSP